MDKLGFSFVRLGCPGRGFVKRRVENGAHGLRGCVVAESWPFVRSWVVRGKVVWEKCTLDAPLPYRGRLTALPSTTGYFMVL
jgi:hypothetical protein